MANKAISELPQAQNVNNQDLFVLEQSGIAKKMTAETFITEQGIIDALAEALDGHGGIQSVTLSSVSGRIRTYLITFTDETTTTFQVLDGTSIDRITKTSTAGLVDTYTIFMSDGATSFFQVTNGSKGDPGVVTDEQVTTAVNTWLGANVAQETGYVLDSSLTMSNAAAPADKVGELKNALNIKTNTVNLIGADITRVYPCYIPANTECVISTSDGSNFTSNYLYLYDENGNVLNDWALQASNGTYRTIPARNYTVHYAVLQSPSVPLMFNIGSTPLPYTKYKANLDMQLFELMELKQLIENGYIEISNFITGNRGNRASITKSSVRCTIYKSYALSKGDSIAVSSIDNGLKVAIAGVKNGNYLVDSGWKTGDYSYTVEENKDCYYFVNLAKVDGTALTPSEILTTKIQIRNSAFVLRNAEIPIINAFSHVAWDSQNPTGQSYIDAVESAFNN